MQRITLEEYKNLLSITSPESMLDPDLSIKAKEYIEKHYSDEQLQRIIDNTINFISRLLIVLKNQQPKDETTVVYSFELPLESTSNIISNGSNMPADELFYLENSASKKISTKIIDYIFGIQTTCYLSSREETYQDITLRIPEFNIVIPVEEINKALDSQTKSFN